MRPRLTYNYDSQNTSEVGLHWFSYRGVGDHDRHSELTSNKFDDDDDDDDVDAADDGVGGETGESWRSLSFVANYKSDVDVRHRCDLPGAAATVLKRIEWCL